MNLDKAILNANNDLQYELVENDLRDEMDKCWKSFGISAQENGKELCRISDVTVNKDSIIKLIERCNSLKVSSCQIRDVVDDFLLAQ